MTNEEVRNRVQNAIGVHDDLLTMVKKRKLRWYGHISRPSGMAKTVLQGTVKGARRRGRKKKRWEDNIKEWTGMGFGDSLRAAEDRERYCCNIICGAPTTSEVKGLRWDEREIVKPYCSSYRVLTANVLGVRIFRNVRVLTLLLGRFRPTKLCLISVRTW